MIPRYQRILFWTLIAGILLMAAFLLRGCQQAHKRLAALDDATPIAAPTTANTEDVTLYLANDSDASITPTTESLALPQEPTVRARALLDHLLASYALPASAHPLQSGPAVDDVFLLSEPDRTENNSAGSRQPPRLLRRQPSLRHPGRSPHPAIHHRHPPRRSPPDHPFASSSTASPTTPSPATPTSSAPTPPPTPPPIPSPQQKLSNPQAKHS